MFLIYYSSTDCHPFNNKKRAEQCECQLVYSFSGKQSDNMDQNLKNVYTFWQGNFLLKFYHKEITRDRECMKKAVQSLIIRQEWTFKCPTVKVWSKCQTKYYTDIKINHLARGGSWTRWTEE